MQVVFNKKLFVCVCVEASVALQVLSVLCSLSFVFLAVKKQLEEKAEYTLKC